MLKSKKIGRVTFNVGDKVTVKYPIEHYYSGYAGRPVRWFKSGDVAIIESISPKVRITGDAPTHDQRDEFIVADVLLPDGTIENDERVSINFCNAVKVDK